MPKVSVLVPVYNVERYLPQCLDSLISQTLQDIEIIAVDDGSTDSSGKILDEYAAKDSRIQVIHKQNTGYGNTMNVGLSRATGEYVGILESDDFTAKDTYEKMYAVAVKETADIVKANYYHLYDARVEINNILKDYPKGQIFNAVSCPEIIDRAEAVWAGIYRREFLEKQRIRFHETPGAAFQDISFAIQVWAKAQRVYLMPDAFVYYRRDNPGSSMHNPCRTMNVFDEYEWLEEILAATWKQSPVLERYFVATKYRDYFNHYYRVAAPYQYALLVKIANSFEADLRAGRVFQEAFRPHVWDQLSRIHEDKDSFFLASAKELHDPRFSFCEFQNEKLYVDGFITGISRFPQVVIYGAGKVGQWLYERFQAKGVPVTCFAVTARDGNNKECLGLPVRELKELQEYATSCAVILGVAERLQFELYQTAKDAGFQKIYRLDPMLRKAL